MVVVKGCLKGGIPVGDWKIEAPHIDYENCTSCMLCEMYCPEASITANEYGKPEVDMRFCKGCGICSNECTSNAIKMEKEEK